MRVRVSLLAVLVMALFPVTASADYAHVVQPGETLTSVAATDGLSIEAIANANGISPQAQLIIGQTLWIPPRTTANAALGAAAANSAVANQAVTGATQQVTPTTTGDTATVSTDPDTDGDVDSRSGSRTRVLVSNTSQSSGVQTSTGTQASAGATAQAGSVSQSTSAAGAPIPTQERVSSVQIAGVADANGVPAALAEAIAWQESGWNNAEVSNVGAVGVMQIVPSTWTWIDQYLTPSNPLGTASATENVRAGVLLLRQLLQLTGGNEQLAVAGYFQGLASVQRYGMYASTRRYVADVLALAQRFGA